MSYRVVLLRRAQTDVDDIFAWLSKMSATGAERWLAAFDTAIERLEAQPESYGVAPENELVTEEIRQILFRTRRGRNYRAIFTIAENEVRILHVRAPDQRLLTADEL